MPPIRAKRYFRLFSPSPHSAHTETRIGRQMRWPYFVVSLVVAGLMVLLWKALFPASFPFATDSEQHFDEVPFVKLEIEDTTGEQPTAKKEQVVNSSSSSSSVDRHVDDAPPQLHNSAANSQRLVDEKQVQSESQ